MRQARGPHGIPLLNHAQAGGDEAAPVVAFLQTDAWDAYQKLEPRYRNANRELAE